jgi:hypothetical protein
LILIPGRRLPSLLESHPESMSESTPESKRSAQPMRAPGAFQPTPTPVTAHPRVPTPRSSATFDAPGASQRRHLSSRSVPEPDSPELIPKVLIKRALELEAGGMYLRHRWSAIHRRRRSSQARNTRRHVRHVLLDFARLRLAARYAPRCCSELRLRGLPGFNWSAGPEARDLLTPARPSSRAGLRCAGRGASPARARVRAL